MHVIGFKACQKPKEIYLPLVRCPINPGIHKLLQPWAHHKHCKTNIFRKDKKIKVAPLGVITGASRPTGSPRLLFYDNSSMGVTLVIDLWGLGPRPFSMLSETSLQSNYSTLYPACIPAQLLSKNQCFHQMRLVGCWGRQLAKDAISQHHLHTS